MEAVALTEARDQVLGVRLSHPIGFDWRDASRLVLRFVARSAEDPRRRRVKEAHVGNRCADGLQQTGDRDGAQGCRTDRV